MSVKIMFGEYPIFNEEIMKQIEKTGAFLLTGYENSEELMRKIEEAQIATYKAEKKPEKKVTFVEEDENGIRYGFEEELKRIVGEKPPVGLCPRRIRDKERLEEIMAAVYRYMDAGKFIPEAWVDELGDILFDYKEK